MIDDRIIIQQRETEVNDYLKFNQLKLIFRLLKRMYVSLQAFVNFLDLLTDFKGNIFGVVNFNHFVELHLHNYLHTTFDHPHEKLHIYHEPFHLNKYILHTSAHYHSTLQIDNFY